MGRDVNGTWTRVHNWVTDKNNSVKITASRFDAENDDFASGLSASGETAKIVNGAYNHLGVVETTAENSISATPTVAITSYTTGQPNWWIPGFNNTGSVTMTISGLSAASVQCAGAALTSGMLLSGVPAMTVSDGSGFHLMNPMRSPADWMNTAGLQDNSVTIAKLNHETTQGALLSYGASGTPQYITATTSGLPLVTKGASVDAAFQQIGAVGIADRAITVEKFGSDTTQGAILSHTASGAPAYITATTSGLPLVTKGASVDAAFQKIGTAGIADNSITLAQWNHETVQGALVYTDASGTPTYLAPGTSGQVLQSGGASANPSWAAAGLPSDNSITLAKMAHDVQGTLIYMDASGTPTYLAAGTNGQVLQSGGASANPSWGDATGGGWEFVSSVTGSASSTIAFTNMESGYDYQYVLQNITVSIDVADLEVEFGIAGPTYRSGSGYEATSQSTTVTGASQSTEHTDKMILVDQTNSGLGTGTNERVLRMTLELNDPANSGTFTSGVCYGFEHSRSSELVPEWAGAMYTTAEAHTSIKFVLSTGNLTGPIYQYRRSLS